MWLVLSIVSAFLLGIYESQKKRAVAGNAAVPVLAASILIAAAIWAGAILFDVGLHTSAAAWFEPLTPAEHGLIFLKSGVTATSWLLSYIALARLPLSIASPLRSTGPLWTILFATTLLGESPTFWQWFGMLVMLASLITFSVVGRREGIVFRRDGGVRLMLLATLIGAVSGLYDKYLLQNIGIRPMTLQAWFSVYLVPVFAAPALHWAIRRRRSQRFGWRWAILWVAAALLFADVAYFIALSDPDALVSIVSPLRRLSVIVSVSIGLWYWGERQPIAKYACLTLMLAGVALIAWGTATK